MMTFTHIRDAHLTLVMMRAALHRTILKHHSKEIGDFDINLGQNLSEYTCANNYFKQL